MTGTRDSDGRAHSSVVKLREQDVIARMDELLLQGNGTMEEYVILTKLLRQISTISTTDSERRGALSTLGSALERLCDRSEETVYLQELVDVRRQRLILVSDTDIDIGSFLTDLANALSRLWERLELVKYLDEAIEVYRDAVSRTPSTHRNRARWENNLGNAFMWKYEKTQDIANLSNAIQVYKNAVQHVLHGNLDQIGYLRNLSNSLIQRYESQYSMEDLKEAIKSLQDLVSVCPEDDHNLSVDLSNLGNLLQFMFDMTRSKDILLQALDANERSVRLSTPQDPNRGAYLSSVGTIYLSLYELDGLKPHLEKGIAKHREALQILPAEYRGQCLHNLGNALLRQFEISKDSECFNQAIASLQEAADTLPSGHLNRSECLASLGIAAEQRYKLSHSPDDINLAVSSLQLAVNELQPDNPRRAMVLNYFGTALETQLADSHLSEDFERVIKIYEDGALSIGSPPSSRIIAARNAAKFLLFRDVYRASEIYKLAVDLLPSVSPRTLHWSEQQTALSEFSGLGSIAAALCLLVKGTPIEALRRQEQGRGIMASLLSDTRSEISELETAHPALACRFQEIRDELDTPIARYSDISIPNRDLYQFQLKARRCDVLSLQFNQILEEIRKKEGFKSFLLPPSEEDMKQLAKQGPIIVFNICHLRCDAFLITPDSITNLYLKDLRYEDILRRAEILKEQLNASRSQISRDARPKFYQDRGEQMSTLLDWLWSVAARPVLDQLGFMNVADNGNPLPRVWWVTTGALTLFPIHAACRRSRSTSKGVLDHVISSYIPTIKALSLARKRAARLSSEEITNILLIGMPTTPEMIPLPGVLKELEYLKDSLSSSMTTSTLELPIMSEVVSKLQNCQVAHFACHGDSDMTDPSESTLFFRDWKTAPFRVSDIVKLKLATAHFAYLSLCHAANTSDMALLDESIHLAGAFHLAGFPSLIATLWQIHDNQSARFAKTVYEYLVQANGRIDLSKACEGVHKATRQLRDETEGNNVAYNPFVWAPYIYIGP